MVHRLGMYYLAQQLQDAQDAKAAHRCGQKSLNRHRLADHEELGLLAWTGAALVVAMAALGLLLGLTN
ncbi:MAG TPA: hypothetical protein VGN82_07820 [Bosea sp. (in: a-proteobacteria)]|jgi:hypothetical protein|uniref:hypothetical protein n=1 Tax=Bosea sp. (in: a-proteobacteria) TaxID=1871050 RepID=UPI002E129B5C|nr:hypothetical protein [Bosea sp. (in: a-proteobacteria)]